MANRYPQNRHEMLRAHYTLVYSRPCPRCNAPTDHWRTANGKEITMNRGTEYETVVPHSQTCTRRREQQDRRENAARPVVQFATRHRAAAVLVIDRFGRPDFTVDVLADPADMHTTLVTAAGAVRDFLVNHQNGSN